jgi:hypothetical protein
MFLVRLGVTWGKLRSVPIVLRGPEAEVDEDRPETPLGIESAVQS